MTEFIVLGQIPGTTLQITFAWFMLIVLLFIGWLDLTQRKTSKQSNKSNKKSLKTTTK